MSDNDKPRIMIDRYGNPLGTPPEIYRDSMDSKNDIDHGNIFGDSSQENKDENEHSNINRQDGCVNEQPFNDSNSYNSQPPVKEYDLDRQHYIPQEDHSYNDEQYDIDNHRNQANNINQNYADSPQNYIGDHYKNYMNEPEGSKQPAVNFENLSTDNAQFYDTSYYNNYNNDNFYEQSQPFYYNSENLDFTNYKQLESNNPNYVPPKQYYDFHYASNGETQLYVNVKQFHCIRKRKVRRDFLDTMMLKVGQAGYLHESRHRHAMNRMRAPSGRFLTKEETADLMKQQNQTE